MLLKSRHSSQQSPGDVEELSAGGGLGCLLGCGSGDGKTCCPSWRISSLVSDSSEEQMALCMFCRGDGGPLLCPPLKNAGGCVHMLLCNYPLSTQIITIHRDTGAKCIPDTKLFPPAFALKTVSSKTVDRKSARATQREQLATSK